jgi:predicted DNA-binding transcriptional regulator YafY
LPKTYAMPTSFDVLKYLRESIAALERTHTIVVRFTAEISAVRRSVPASIGKLTQEKNAIRLDAQADNLDWFARELSRLDLPFEIVKPPALKSALMAHLRGLLDAQSS